MEQMGNLRRDFQTKPVGLHGGGRHGPEGLPSVPTTHEAIHNHSWRGPRANWVWISKTSMMDDEVNLGFPTSVSDVKKFGATTRRAFIHAPSS
jgi:hypothetical protein